MSIAHRLRTVVEYDLVLVLESGRVKELGPPAELLERAESAFLEICRQTGDLEALIAMSSRVKNFRTSE